MKFYSHVCNYKSIHVSYLVKGFLDFKDNPPGLVPDSSLHHTHGYEAFVFIVGKDNPVENLTIEQVQGLYTGKYTNWSEVPPDTSMI